MIENSKRGFIAFLVTLLAPFALILGGAGLASLGVHYSWNWMLWTGLFIVGAGLIWGLLLLFFLGEPLF